jgi:hypothetical protein
LCTAPAGGNPHASPRVRKQDIEAGPVIDGRPRHGVTRRANGAGELLDGADSVAVLGGGAEAIEHWARQFLAAGVAAAPGAGAGAGAGAHVRATRHALDVCGGNARAPERYHGGLSPEAHNTGHSKPTC